MKSTAKSNIHILSRYEDQRSKERIEQACKDHTAFKAKNFEDDPSLVVLEMGKEIYFDTEGLSLQPRSENLHQSTVQHYANQCEGVKVGTDTIYGIRKAIDATLWPKKAGPRFIGLRGHHRYATAEKKRYKYIICKIHPDFHTWSSEDKIDFLNRDNAHDHNGLQMKDICIKASFAQLLKSKDFMTIERDRLKQIQGLMDCTSDKTKTKEYKNQQKKLDMEIRDRLVTLAKGWGAGNSDQKLKRLATQARKTWSADDVTKLYVHSEEEFEEIINKVTNGLSGQERFHSSRATALGGQVPLKALNWGFVTKSADYREDTGQPLKVFHFFISIPGASSIHNLFSLRKSAADKLKKYCRGPDPIDIKCHFLGQVRTPDSDYIENLKVIYTLEYVNESLKSLKKPK